MNLEGGQLALVGYVLETVVPGNEHSLEPLLLLAPYPGSRQYAVVWSADEEAVETFASRFDLEIEQPTPTDILIK
jgi:hypothetical protein